MNMTPPTLFRKKLKIEEAIFEREVLLIAVSNISTRNRIEKMPVMMPTNKYPQCLSISLLSNLAHF